MNEEQDTKQELKHKVTNRCECCSRKKTLNKFKWLDNKTLLCYECADRIGRCKIWEKNGMEEAIRLQRISYTIEGVVCEVLKRGIKRK